MSNEKKIGMIIAFVVLLIFLIALRPFVVIGAGERGVVLNWGAVSEKVMDEGLHFKMPIYQSVKKINVRTQKVETNVLAYSNDIQTVDTTIALNFHLSANTVNKLYQEVGIEYALTIIAPAIQESG